MFTTRARRWRSLAQLLPDESADCANGGRTRGVHPTARAHGDHAGQRGQAAPMRASRRAQASARTHQQIQLGVLAKPSSGQVYA